MANIDIKISEDNLLDWSHMEDWVNGASSAPTNHTLSGASASVARESTIIKVGTYSAAVTRSGADASLYYDHADYEDYQNRKVTFGCWVYATVASRGRILISDGVGSTASSYHTGAAGWEYLTVTHDIDGSATRMRVEMQVNTGNTTVYFDAGILVEDTSTITIITDIADLGKWKETNRYSMQEYDLPRRDGVRVPNLRINSKSLATDMMAIGSTATIKRTNFDLLTKALNSFHKKPNGDIQLKNLYFFDDRYYKCYVDKFDVDTIAAGRINKINVQFTIPQAYHQAVNKTRTLQALAGTTTFTVTNNGSAISRPVITVNNTSSNISSLIIENLTTDQIFNYSGTIQTGDALVIDTDRLTVENDGTGDLTNVTNEVLIILYPGANRFKVTGVPSGSVTVDWFDRWY